MALLIFIIGTILGSFYLVVGTRLPKGEDVIKSRSRCDNCGVTLKWYNLIPLLSFIFQRGKCQKCGKKITLEHFLVELATGLLFLFCYNVFSSYEFYVSLIISSLLIVIFISDFKYMIILDSSLIISLILLVLLKVIYFDFKTLVMSFLSGLILLLVMILVERIGTFLFKKESLGGGDIKLAFLIGFILDYKLGLVALVLSTFLALPYAVATLYMGDSHEFPYGPFLVGALFIVFVFMDKFINLTDMLII